VRWTWIYVPNITVVMTLSELVLIKNNLLCFTRGRDLFATMESIREALDCPLIVQIGTISIGNLERISLGEVGRKW
jgi:hypothetical protein